MIYSRVLLALALINWSFTINFAGKVSTKFAETRPGQVPNDGVTQIAALPTPSAIGCAKLCWENVNSTGCRGIIYQPDTCGGNSFKPSSPGLCQMLGFSETTPLSFGTANKSICQKFYSLPLANCSIAAKSYSKTSGSCTGSTIYNLFGYVSLNGNMVFNMSSCSSLQTSGNPRGVTLVTIDPLSCTFLRSQLYDTYLSAANANAMATALRTAANGTVFVAVTADDAQASIATANSTLLTACNVNITSFQFRGTLAFVCAIGRPVFSKWQLKPPQLGPGSTVAATVIGTPVGGSLSIV